MAYYIRSYHGHIHGSQMLVELTSAEAREVVHESYAADEPDYRRVSATYAHQWVRGGLPHETALWIDFDNRVRYARESY